MSDGGRAHPQATCAGTTYPPVGGEWLDLTDAVGKPTIAGLIAADAIERQFTGRTDEQVAMAACEALQAWAAAVGPTP